MKRLDEAMVLLAESGKKQYESGIRIDERIDKLVSAIGAMAQRQQPSR